MSDLRRADLAYPELSYKIMGIIFSVNTELGHGLQEKYYQRALAIAFAKNQLNFKEQVYIPIQFLDSKVGSYFLDFLIEDKIILEIKRGDHFAKTNIQQILAYLKVTGLKLGILVNFTLTGVKYKRIVNME